MRFGRGGDDSETPSDDRLDHGTAQHPTHTAAIAVEGLTKRYGEVTAVDDLSFTVRAGAVTGFLGPNGAGKTTALKTIVGLARPTAGRILVNGAPSEQRAPDARALGVYIEPCGAHPGRTARDHLRSLAAIAGLPGGRVDEVPDNVFAVGSRINSTWGGSLTDMVRARRILEVVEAEELLQLAGSYRPNRHAQRRAAPKSTEPVGDPPPHLAEDEATVWHEFVRDAVPGVLTGYDRWAPIVTR